MFKRFACVRAHDPTDCGAAALATVALHYKLKIPISKIREVAGTDTAGTSIYGLTQAAISLGFYAKAVKGNRQALLSKEFNLPCIAFTVNKNQQTHFVVIHSIDNRTITVADPIDGIVMYKLEDFLRIWLGSLIILVPSPQFASGNQVESSLSGFFKLLLPQKRLLLFIFLASVLITVFGIVGAFYFKLIMDTIVPGSLRTTLTTISIGLIVLFVFKAVTELFRGQLTLYLSQKLDIPLLLGYYQHVIGLPMSFFGTRKVGEIISRFMDATKIRDAISGTTLTVTIDAFMAVIGGIVLFLQSTTLFLIALVMVILYGVVVFAFNRPIRSINEKTMENNAQLNSYLVESISNIETIKTTRNEDSARLNTDKLFVRLLKSIFKNGEIMNYQSAITTAIASVGGAIILWVGTLEVLDGAMTLGSLITFNALLVYFVEPVKNIINLQPDLQTAFVAARRLGEILILESEDSQEGRHKIAPKTLKGHISFEGVSFRYGTRNLVLRDISLDIPKGSRVALVGESGSGKTTLVNLLMRLYKWEEGEILIDGNNIKDISLDTLRSRIGYVSQEIQFFSGSIRENLMLGAKDCDLETMVSICSQIGASSFINKLPLRYETYLEENAANISGGQRQMLSIARALMKAPDILIMDEATSHLDSRSERTIQDTIDSMPKDVTVFLIAHRLSSIVHCDTILVMHEGEIIERGTHIELIASNGHYANLWSKQMLNEQESS